MKTITEIKKNYSFLIFQKLLIISILIGFLASFLAISLKQITEHYETIFFLKSQKNRFLLLLFPLFGFSVIYLLREFLFKKKVNKGVREIYEITESPTKNLPTYKIASHFINGLLTVIFGGSTGIEVSTVVATATIGSVGQQKANFFRKYKTELICAGISAGITALFCSPIAGILFSLEVISRKATKFFIFTNVIAVTVASGFLYILEEKSLFNVNITTWHYHAIPYFILLGLLAGINSVYLTKMVLFFKAQFAKIEKQYLKIILGGLILSFSIMLFPELYGDGYHALKVILTEQTTTLNTTFVLSMIGLLILKPIVTSVTLASGGDGGVFAPSIFTGAFLGLILVTFLNSYFNTNLIPINFIIIGIAAVLSASIHAPLTALFLTCALINDYTLFFPILVVSLLSKYTAKFIFPYTVYSYQKI